MGETPSKALSAEGGASKLQKKSLCPFPNLTIPRKSRTSRPVSKGINSYDVLIGKKEADTFSEEYSEIHDPGFQHGPSKKKLKLLIELTAEQGKKDSVVNQHTSRRKKRKQEANDSNDDVYFPRFRVRGASRGNRRTNSLNSGKLDSKTFQQRMEHIWSTCPGERNSFSYLDCLWFHLHSQKASKARVLSWAEKKKDAFTKQYVLVPIVMWSHWSLLILCNFGESHQSPCMLLLDSLQTANPRRLEPLIRKFVSDLYNIDQRPGKVKSSSKIPLLVPKVPQQRDGEECGSFVLYYVNLFLQRAPEEFSTEGYPYFMKEDWFKFDDFDNFCKRLEVESKANDASSSDGDVVEVSSEQPFVIG